MLELVRKHGIEVPDEITAEELSAKLQAEWFQVGKLRYQISGGPPTQEDTALLRAVGCVDQIGVPNSWSHEGIIVPGALLARVRSRLAFALELHEREAVKSCIYLLGSARPLDPTKEGKEALCTPGETPFKQGWIPHGEMPKTEAEMMKLVVDQSDLPSDTEIVVIDTPLQQKSDGGLRPPNTSDTVKEWLKIGPPGGLYVLVSNQPFVRYQEFATNNVLNEFGHGQAVVGVGPSANLALPLKTFLDNVAKQLFEEIK